MSNILEAICNIVEHESYEIHDQYVGRNRMNGMGDTLENFIKDAFAGTLQSANEQERLTTHNNVFTWLGSQNNPPDMILRDADAIEVKKTQSPNSVLALNSSYPKAYLNSSNHMITDACRACEDWTEKDIIYCVGHTSDTVLHSLWMVYGSIYAANDDVYSRIKSVISDGIRTIPDVVFSETKELGRVNQVDPLGITNLRIRGMWQIENPRRVFSYIYQRSEDSVLDLVCLIPTDKYESFSTESKNRLQGLSLSDRSLLIEDVNVRNPNNPALLIQCKFIHYVI